MASHRTLGILLAGLLAAAVPAGAQRGPAPAPTRLPAGVLSLACAPALTYQPPAATLRITGGQDSFVRLSYAPGDLVTINAGTDHGISVGQEFFVRRVLAPEERAPITHETPGVIRTTGWIRVYAVDERLSLATITHACETIDIGDYLEPLVLPIPPAAADLFPAQRDNYGRVLMGNDRRRSFGRGDYLTVDRGSDHGVSPGTRFALYRDKLMEDNFLFHLGEAVAVSVEPDSSTLQVTTSLDAIQAGDYAAMRHESAE